MPTITTIDPVTRLEGHLKIQVTVDTVNGVQQVVDAKATGTLFRGFENILLNRTPTDAQHITQRICGVCPVSHGMAAVLALDAACRVTVPNNARIMRNLVLAANMIDSHILHFYHLTMPDFINGPDMPPWQPSWTVDKRFNCRSDQRPGNPLCQCPGYASQGPRSRGHLRRPDAASAHLYSRRLHDQAHCRGDHQV